MAPQDRMVARCQLVSLCPARQGLSEHYCDATISCSCSVMLLSLVLIITEITFNLFHTNCYMFATIDQCYELYSNGVSVLLCYA